MRDVIMLAVTTAFFASCVAYVRWCDHIIGPDPVVRPDDRVSGERGAPVDVEEVSA